VVDPLPEQGWELEFPSAEQYAPSFAGDITAWPDIVSRFPDDVQEEIDGLLYRIEESDDVETDLLRQLSLIFKGNAEGREDALRISQWLDKMADYADFLSEGIDFILDLAVGDEEDEAEGEEAENLEDHTFGSEV